MLAFHYMAGGEVSLGEGVWGDKAVLLALLPPRQSSDTAGAGSLVLSVCGLIQGCPGCVLWSTLLRGCFAMQAAGCKGWSHLFGVWAWTRVAEGYAKVEISSMLLTQQVSKWGLVG